MNWIRKGIEITVNQDGMFEYSIYGKKYTSPSLSQAKEKINEITKEYYNFTMADLKCLLKKLNNREKEFVLAVINELEEHSDSAYCELGVNLDFNFAPFFEDYLKDTKL